VRKLPKVDDMQLEALIAFSSRLEEEHIEWHAIVTNHYIEAILHRSEMLNLHPLQKIILTKSIKKIPKIETYEYEAEDRDAVLDIPYMN